MAAPRAERRIACRGSQGVWFVNEVPDYSEDPNFPRDDSSNANFSGFSVDGSFFVYGNQSGVTVFDTVANKVKHTLALEKAVGAVVSPRNGYLATIQQYTVDRENKQGVPNFTIWNMETGKKVRSFCQKKMNDWAPQWTRDDTVASRLVNNEIQFFEGGNWDTPKVKLHLEKVSTYCMTHNPSPCHVAAHIPGSKGSPSSVRLFKYPNFSGQASAIVTKSFFKCDRVELQWNSKGTALLVHTFAEVSDASYYGDQGLHFITTSGVTSLVSLLKRGPIYAVRWHKSGSEFYVVYGHMPSKVTIFNLSAEPVFDFGEGKRNGLSFNPRGTLVCFTGLGNLPGFLEMWDVAAKKKVCALQVPKTTQIGWCPDGEKIFTATTAPRLKIENGFRVWHYTGALLHSTDISAQSAELRDIHWMPANPDLFPRNPLRYTPVESNPAAVAPVAQAAPYRPPSARGQTVSFQVHADMEKASNQKEVDPSLLSKSALKNKKKREKQKAAKAAGTAEESSQPAQPSAPAQPQRQPSAPAPTPAPAPAAAPAPAPAATGGPMTDTEKKIRAVKKKLQQIEKMKVDLAAGKTLEKNQMEKLANEGALLDELERLSLG